MRGRGREREREIVTYMLRCYETPLFSNKEVCLLHAITTSTNNLPQIAAVIHQMTLWRNGSASDSRSEGCV